jgi:cytochrome P450
MEKQTPLGPKGLPIIGNLREFSGDDRLENLKDWKATYGDTVRLKLLNRTAYLLTSPDDVYKVLVKESKKIHKSPVFKRGLTRVLGEGLLLSEDDFHKRQRRLTQPAFHMQRIANYADTIVDHGERLVNSWENDQEVDLHDEMMTVTMEIIAKVLFDADVSQDASHIGDAVTVGIDAVMNKITKVINVPEWIPTPANRRATNAFDLLDDTINDIIADRRKTMEDKGDLLSMLLLSVDEDGETMTDKQVRDEAMTLFLAGHETTSNTLTWTFYLLSQHPDILQKLQDEVDTVLGKRRASLDDLKQLTYTEMVIKESMRLYPPAWITTRIVIEPIEFDTFTAEEGDLLMMSAYLTHNDPARWDNPETFDPLRFTPEAEKTRHKFAYFPFGGGPRVCIGNHFAMMEAQLLLATILQHYTADLAPNADVIPEPLITLRAKHGVPVILRKRQPEMA